MGLWKQRYFFSPRAAVFQSRVMTPAALLSLSWGEMPLMGDGDTLKVPERKTRVRHRHLQQ